MNCPLCGFANASVAAFCAGCGRPSNAAAGNEQGARRQLTVLMCDLVGSTALSQSLDPEDLRAILADYHRVCAEVVDDHDGHLAQYLGDGVVIYFGFPHAHEDDARRAVRCGLDILSRAQELSRGVARRSSVELQMRVGAHTGRVVVGDVGPQKESLAHGDTPNIAARVQSVSDPGSLAVTDATWRIVQGYFRGESLGEWELKGIARPTGLWRVTGTSGAKSRLEARGDLTGYVGRQRECGLLEEEWTAVTTGSARFVTVRGEAGIGKSRLVHEFRQRVAGPSVDQLELRFTPYSQNSTFLSVKELVEGRLGLDDSVSIELRLDRVDERVRELGLTSDDAAPILAEFLSIPITGRYPPLVISPIRRRTRTLEILVAAIQALASRRPTILVAEDLHWADPSTLELLKLIVTSEARLPLLGLFTARPEFEPAWAEASSAALIDVARLEDAEVETIVRALAHDKLIPGEVMREITRRCDGVPLFVEEVVDAVLDSGVLKEREFSWELTGPLLSGLVPASVDASLMARIDRLGDSRDTAQLAATIGREFSNRLLRAVSDRGKVALDEDLQRMVEAGLVWDTSSGDAEGFVFKHALIQEAAYESLLRSNRQLFHGRIARALQEDFSTVADERPELVAHHLTGAGDDEHAVGYWEIAGRRALERTAMHEAAAHFRRAIEGVSRLPDEPYWLERELDLQNGIAPVLMAVHGWGSTHVRQACERARDLAIRLERDDKIYPAMRGIWTNYFLRGEMDEALAMAKSVLEIAEASGIPGIRVTGHHATAFTHLYRGEFGEALREADAGLAFFDLEQERVLVASFQLAPSVALRMTRTTALWMLGQLEEAEHERARMIQLGRDLDNAFVRAMALAFQLYTGLCFGWHEVDVGEQIAVADRLRALSKDEGFFLWHGVGSVYRGAAAVLAGDAGLANALIRDGFEEFMQTKARATLVTMHVMCAQARAQLDDVDEAWRHLDDAQSQAETGGERMWEPEIDRIRASLQRRSGNAAGAETSLRQALVKSRSQNAHSLELRAVLDLYELLANSDRRDEGRALVEGVVNAFDPNSRAPEVARARSICVLA